MRKRIAIIIVTLVSIIILGERSNKISFDPNFSAIDAFTSATKRAKRDAENQPEEAAEEWHFSYEEFALEEKAEHLREATLVSDTDQYRILWNKERRGKDTYTLLVNQQAPNMDEDVSAVSRLLREEGYEIEIKECSELMYSSLIHARKFDIVYMGREQ